MVARLGVTHYGAFVNIYTYCLKATLHELILHDRLDPDVAQVGQVEQVEQVAHRHRLDTKESLFLG